MEEGPVVRGVVGVGELSRADEVRRWMQQGGRERISGVIFAMRLPLRWVQGLMDALEIGQTVHVNKKTIRL